MNAYVCVCVCMRVCVRVCVFVCICMYLCTCTVVGFQVCEKCEKCVLPKKVPRAERVRGRICHSMLDKSGRTDTSGVKFGMCLVDILCNFPGVPIHAVFLLMRMC